MQAALSWVYVLAVLFTQGILAQGTDPYVDGLEVKVLSPSLIRLTWKPVASVPCEYKITYSVYRDTDEDFDPVAENRVASGLVTTSFVAHETSKQAFYYPSTGG